MFKPKFNHVLVEIDDKDAQWGKSSDGSFAGEVYREGKVIEVGEIFETSDYPIPCEDVAKLLLNDIEGKYVMWNEGHEAGKVFEHDQKRYALIYWWDIVGVKEEGESNGQ